MSKKEQEIWLDGWMGKLRRERMIMEVVNIVLVAVLIVIAVTMYLKVD